MRFIPYNDDNMDNDSDDEDEVEMMGLLPSKNSSKVVERGTRIRIDVQHEPKYVWMAGVFLLIISLVVVSFFKTNTKHKPNETMDIFEYDDGEIFENINVDDDWEEFFSVSEAKQISIIGERNSGVSWLTNSVDKCFQDLQVIASLTRPAHLFQSEEMHDPLTPIVVLNVYLDPYNWVDILRRYPRYMSNHMGMNWEQFVKKEWSTERPERDLEYLKTHSRKNRTCQSEFNYDEIVPCVKEDLLGASPVYQSMYELNVDGSGNAYKNVLELRTAKITNHQQVRNWSNITYLSVKYEQFTEKGGFDTFMKMVRDITGFNITCDLTDSKFVAPSLRQVKLDPTFVDWMNDKLNWRVEQSIGFDRMDADIVNSLVDIGNREDIKGP